MIGGSIAGKLAAVSAMLMMATDIPVTAFSAPPTRPLPGFGRGRSPSSRSYYGDSRCRKIPPAGTKLARKAAKGLIGVRKGW